MTSPCQTKACNCRWLQRLRMRTISHVQGSNQLRLPLFRMKLSSHVQASSRLILLRLRKRSLPHNQISSALIHSHPLTRLPSQVVVGGCFQIRFCDWGKQGLVTIRSSNTCLYPRHEWYVSHVSTVHTWHMSKLLHPFSPLFVRYDLDELVHSLVPRNPLKYLALLVILRLSGRLRRFPSEGFNLASWSSFRIDASNLIHDLPFHGSDLTIFPSLQRLTESLHTLTCNVYIRSHLNKFALYDSPHSPVYSLLSKASSAF